MRLVGMGAHQNSSDRGRGHGLQIVISDGVAPGPASPLPRSLVYERVLREVGRRVQRVYARMQAAGELLPEGAPVDRPLTAEEVEELAWRAYILACVTRASLLRCSPELVLMAAEWWASPEPRAWEAFCDGRLT